MSEFHERLFVFACALLLAGCALQQRGAEPEPTLVRPTGTVTEADLRPFEFTAFEPIVVDPEQFEGTGGDRYFCIEKSESLVLIEEMAKAQRLIKRLQEGYR